MGIVLFFPTCNFQDRGPTACSAGQITFKNGGLPVDVIFVDKVPKPAPKARLKYDKVRGQHFLLLPEKVVTLNETAASILALSDGIRTVHTIAERLRDSLQAGIEAADANELPDLKTMEADITEFVQEMADRGWVVID